MMDFKDSVVLITGAGRGLGLSYARYLGQLGATILLQDIGADSDGNGKDPEVVERAARTLRQEGLKAHAIVGDISSREGCQQLCSDAVLKRGRLDALIHNAGWVTHERLENLDEPAFDTMMTIATKAPLWLAQAAWPTMKAAGHGRIVMTTSCRALYPQYVQRGLAAYAAAKMAVVGLVNVLAAEGKQDGILVNAVSPVAKTRMWGIEGEPDELRACEVAPGVAYLASSACLEGGWILRAANGQFHATRAMEAEGVDYPRDLAAIRASTVHEVATKWPLIAVPNVEPRACPIHEART